MIVDYQNTFNHDIYNNLNKIRFYIKKSSKKLKNEESKDIFHELNSRVSSINEIYHQLLGRWSDANAPFLKLTEGLISHIKNIERNSSVDIHIDIPGDLHFSYRKSKCLSHIVNEFITNSFKHAFTDTKRGIITITIQEKENHYMLTLSDNGKGLDSKFDFDALESFGLQSIDKMTKQLGGSYSFESKNGLTLTVIFSEHEPL